MQADFGIRVELDSPYAEAVPLVTAALKAEGFGVLTEIDVQATLREKLGVERDPYVILGACNPPLAHRALTLEPEIGLLLPCNVIVFANESGGSTVVLTNPMALMSVADNPDLPAVAADATARLERAAAALAQQSEPAADA